MDIITRARTAANELRLDRMLVFGIPFVLVCCVGLWRFADASGFGLRWLLPAAMGLFFVMMIEDWREMTVDTRLTGVLLLLSLLSSEAAAGTFLFTFLLALLPLRILFLISSLARTFGVASSERKVCYDGIPPKFLPFLSSFGIALVAFSFMEITQQLAPFAFLEGMRDALSALWGILSVEQMTAVLLLLVLAWGVLELVYRRRARHLKLTEEDAAIGMGDVIVLPIFAAFLGITTFSFVLLLACIVHAGIYLCSLIHWEV